jgi:hypothetical protein
MEIENNTSEIVNEGGFSARGGFLQGRVFEKQGKAPKPRYIGEHDCY